MQETIAFTPLTTPSFISQNLWLIPAVPIVAAGVIALLGQPKRKSAATLAIGSLSFSLILSLVAFGHVLGAWSHHFAVREIVNFAWFHFGGSAVVGGVLG